MNLRLLGPVALALMPAIVGPMRAHMRALPKPPEPSRAPLRLIPTPAPDDDDEGGSSSMPPVAVEDDDEEWNRLQAMLTGLGCPVDVDRCARKRPPDAPDVAAKKLMRWLTATRSVPLPRMTAAAVERSYRRFCRVDHRTPASIPHVLGAFARLPGVRRREIEGVTDGRRSWTRVYEFGNGEAQAKAPIVKAKGKRVVKLAAKRRPTASRTLRQAA